MFDFIIWTLIFFGVVILAAIAIAMVGLIFDVVIMGVVDLKKEIRSWKQ